MLLFVFVVFFFFFKQKTAYEMRISDWSSDVCSSDLLARATCYHGAYPHFLNGATGATIPFGRKDDGGDLVETSLLFQGLLCARQYFDRDTPAEIAARNVITWLWHDVEWDWSTPGGQIGRASCRERVCQYV